MTTADYERARRALMRRDPILRETIKRIGPCGMASRQVSDHLTALVRAIVGQQLSSKAAATIFARLRALFPGERITAEGIAALGDQQLRGVGLSAQKLAYLRDLSGRILDGRLRLEALDELSDQQVIERLVEVKGFGIWTAEMFLMFRLNRPDVLPVGDLGICTAVQRIYGLRERPKPRRLTQIGEAWRPYRSVACWYLWESLKSPAPSTTRARARRQSRPASRAR